MFDSDQDQRTLPASPRRRALARQSGSVPRSPDVAATLVLIVFTFGLVFVGPTLFNTGHALISDTFRNARMNATGDELLGQTAAILRFGQFAGAWLLAAVVAAIVGNVAQFGPLFAPRVVQPDPERLSPARGLQRMLSDCHPRALLLNVARLVAIALISAWFIWSLRPALAAPALMEPESVAAALADAVITLGGCLAGGAMVVSLLMALSERLRHEARLRMTRHEAREERQRNEADPAVARQRRERQRSFSSEISRPAGETDD